MLRGPLTTSNLAKVPIEKTKKNTSNQRDHANRVQPTSTPGAAPVAATAVVVAEPAAGDIVKGGNAETNGGSKADNPHGFTKAQDDEIMRRKTDNGGESWAVIAKSLPGDAKTINQCKERFKAIKPADWKPASSQDKQQGAQDKKEDKGGKDKKKEENGPEASGGQSGWNKTGENNNSGGGVLDWDNSGGNGTGGGGGGGDVNDAWDAAAWPDVDIGGGDNSNSGDKSGEADNWNQDGGKGNNAGGNNDNWGDPPGGGSQKNDNATGGDVGGDGWGNDNNWGGNAAADSANDVPGWGQEKSASKFQKSARSKANTNDKAYSKSNIKSNMKENGDRNSNNGHNIATGNGKGNWSGNGNGNVHGNGGGGEDSASVSFGFNDVYPNEVFSMDDLVRISRLLKRDHENVWFRLSCAFRDKTGRYIHEDVFKEKLLGKPKDNIRDV